MSEQMPYDIPYGTPSQAEGEDPDDTTAIGGRHPDVSRTTPSQAEGERGPEQEETGPAD
ncbi:hypothetical protein ACFPM3_22745 [Streptomyces coeruleoprunus]|uniref:Uncharacterized protein n=1 Tax=Streptomyces coeruleoprunus TaxID=285563 RepID=A0ABV9XI47_9ACTN